MAQMYRSYDRIPRPDHIQVVPTLEMEHGDEVEMVVDKPQLGCKIMSLEVDDYVRQVYHCSAHLAARVARGH